jgi:hypothetical protein
VRSSFLTPIVAILIGLLFAWDGYESIQLRQRLAQEGIEVQGRPIEAGSRRGRFDVNYSVTVSYRAGGVPITTSLPITAPLFRRLAPDGVITMESVPVRFARSDPRVAMIVGGSPHESNGKLVVGLVMAGAGLAYVVFLSFRRRMRPHANR